MPHTTKDTLLPMITAILLLMETLMETLMEMPMEILMEMPILLLMETPMPPKFLQLTIKRKSKDTPNSKGV